MTEFDAGVARGRYILDISDVERKRAQLRSVYQGIAQDAAALAKSSVGPATADQVKLQQALARTAQAQARLAAEANKRLQIDQRQAQSDAAIALLEQRRATELARTAAASDKAATAALRRGQAEERAARQGQNGGLGPALPRTFAGVTSAGLAQAAGILGIGVSSQQVAEFVKNSGELYRTTTQADNSLRALAGSSELYGEAIRAAKEQQVLFGGSLKDNIEGLSGLVTVSRSAGVPLARLIDLSQRLSVKDPAQGIGGARIALNEALSGDPTSLARRYEIPRAALAKLRDEATTGAEKLDIIDKYLGDIGISSGLAASGVTEDAKRLNELNQRTEAATLRLGQLVSKLEGAGAQALVTGIQIGGVKLNADKFVAGVGEAAKSAEIYTLALQQGMTGTQAQQAALLYLVTGVDTVTKAQAAGTSGGREWGQAQSAAALAAQEGAQRLERYTEQIKLSAALSGDDIIAKQKQQAEAQRLSQFNTDLAEAAGRVASGQSEQGKEASLLAAKYPELAGQIGAIISGQLQLAGATDAATQKLREQARIAGQQIGDSLGSAFGGTSGKTATAAGTALATLFPNVGKAVGTLAGESAGLAERQRAVDEATRRQNEALANTAGRVKIYREELAKLTPGTAAYIDKQTQLKQAEQQLAEERSRTKIDKVASTNLTLENQAEDHARRLLQIQEDYQLRAARSEEDYQTRRGRDQEDYERRRRKLLAEGKRFEADQLKAEFDREQRRNAEDFARQQARAAQDESIRASREDVKGATAQQRTTARAALRGVRVSGAGSADLASPATAPTALGGTPGSPPPVGAGNQGVATLQISGDVYLDGEKVGRGVFPTIELLLKEDALTVQVSSTPQAQKNAIGGPRP